MSALRIAAPRRRKYGSSADQSVCHPTTGQTDPADYITQDAGANAAIREIAPRKGSRGNRADATQGDVPRLTPENN
jgi:hypothetical protein